MADKISPGTLRELAALAGVDEADFVEFKEADLEDLTKELNVDVKGRVRLRTQHREMLALGSPKPPLAGGGDAGGELTKQTSVCKFNAFLSQLGEGDSMAGLQSVPVVSLVQALAYIEGPSAPTRAALDRACKAAYGKADALLAQGPDPYGLTREEMAAINIFTQDNWSGPGPKNLYRPLNSALRGNSRDDVKVYWAYIRLLQHSLFKLPKEVNAATIFRGVKDPSPMITLDELRAAILSGDTTMWWGFSSTSTNLETVNTFCGEAGPRVIFTIDPGNSARDVRRYSTFVQEDELIMPCGSAFVVKTATSPAPGLLLVSIRQTDDFLITPSPTTIGATVATSTTSVQVAPASQPEPTPQVPEGVPPLMLVPAEGSQSGGVAIKEVVTSGGQTHRTYEDGREVCEFPDGQTQTQYPDGRSEVVFPCGQKQTEYPNGKKETLSPAGQRSTTHPDGTKHVVFPNGQTQTHHPNGKKEVVLPCGQRQTTHPDGTKITESVDGQTTTVYPDRKKVVVFPSGQCQTWLPDGTHVTAMPGGQRQTEYPDGTEVTEFPDGQKQTQFKDGRSETLFPSGQKQTTYPDGRRETVFSDGTVQWNKG